MRLTSSDYCERRISVTPDRCVKDVEKSITCESNVDGERGLPPRQSFSESRSVTLLRGRLGLEVALAGRDLTEAFEELEARLGERPGFYRGTSATANFGARAPAAERSNGCAACLSGRN